MKDGSETEKENPKYSNNIAQIIDSSKDIISSKNFAQLSLTIALVVILYFGYQIVDKLSQNVHDMRGDMIDIKTELIKQTEIMRRERK